MSTVDVTVAVLSYNRPENLPEALGSVLGQTVAPKDIVVLGNGSKPAVKESIQHLLGPGVRWDPAARPHGAAWNGPCALALHAQKSTKYLFVMFDDDRILPDFLEQ